MTVEFKLQSDDVSEIAKALIEVQKVISNAEKDAKNPFFKSNYATLKSVLDATRQPFADNGLAVTQTMVENYLVTTLLHSSGQWIRSYLPLNPTKQNDPQALGSAITYARRYALAAIANITQEDDDGNTASDKIDWNKVSYDEFVAMVRKLDPTLTREVITNTLTDKGFSWKSGNRQAMLEVFRTQSA